MTIMENKVIRQCPHCKKVLNFTEPQKEKLLKSLGDLKTGRSISIVCQHCNKPIGIRKEDKTVKKDAYGMFPDLMTGVAPEKQRSKQKKHTRLAEIDDKKYPDPIKIASSAPPPPEPPDVSWLKTGRHNEESKAQDIPSALLLMPSGDNKITVVEAFRDLGYQVEVADSPMEAIEKTRFVKFAAIVQHTKFEGMPITQSTFHHHVNRLPISTRRYIYYILVGPDFTTLYNLEALSNSANLVVNEKDIKYLKHILRSGFQDFEQLLGPLFNALSDHGKQ